MSAADTIFALSSGPGRAGIAIVRISGRAAGQVAEAMLGVIPPARKALLARIVHPSTRRVLDRAMTLWFPGPASATGEDVLELHLHGSPAVLRAVFEALGELPGLRMAEPGEFTRRAFANGKLDLVEAEGLADLLQAQTEAQRRQAMSHLLGDASSVFEGWRRRLIGAMGLVEAAVDFSEEEDISLAALHSARPAISALIDDMQLAVDGAKTGEAIRDGVRVVLVGPPNTGKSSLLNAMAKRDAAIVSSIPGTTRDVIEVNFDLNGIPVVLCDTAGLRASADEIESIGMARSRKAAGQADIVLWVGARDIAGSMTVDDGVGADLIVENKADLAALSSCGRSAAVIETSSLQPDTVARLLQRLSKLVERRYGRGESGLIVRERQRLTIVDSIRHLNESLKLDTGSSELVAEELRAAAVALGRLTGAIDVEDLLASIFSQFCIGK